MLQVTMTENAGILAGIIHDALVASFSEEDVASVRTPDMDDITRYTTHCIEQMVTDFWKTEREALPFG
jgi:hypothetical protein